jgi:hypothetical protein
MHALDRIAPNRFLRLIGLGAFLLAMLAAVAGDAGTADAAPPTPTVSASASGNRLFLLTSVAGSTTPVNWEVSIGLAAPTGTPPSFGATPVRTARSSSPVFSFSHSFFSVTPNTTYHYIVKATDASGQSSYKTGSVKSKARDILVDFSKITVINDGDGFLRGKGEIRFDFAVNKCWVPEWHTGLRSLDDGQSFDPNRARYYSKYHQSTLDLAIHAIEADNDLWDGFSPLPLIPTGCDAVIQPARGSNDAFDWASAALTVYVNNGYHHLQNSASEKVTFESPAWDGLRFRVEVTLDFTYYAG